MLLTRVRKPSTQELKVLKVLQDAFEGKIEHMYVKNGWVNKQYFVRVLFLTQAGRAIWNLENRMGFEIEHSEFRDKFKFISYRLKPRGTLF